MSLIVAIFVGIFANLVSPNIRGLIIGWWTSRTLSASLRRLKQLEYGNEASRHGKLLMEIKDLILEEFGEEYFQEGLEDYEREQAEEAAYADYAANQWRDYYRGK